MPIPTRSYIKVRPCTRRYTPDQLSKILSAAASGELGLTVCVDLAAYSGEVGTHVDITAHVTDYDGEDWHNPRWGDPDATLRWLTRKGFA